VTHPHDGALLERLPDFSSDSLVGKSIANAIQHVLLRPDGSELVYLWFGHLRRMPHMMKKDETFDPVAIGLFSPSAIVARAQGFPELIEELRFGTSQRIRTSDKRSLGLPVRWYGLIDGSYFERRSRFGHSFAPIHV
jgi:hypothetical protein